eukprot:scaffold40748_cov336-Skeletonema_marinoi.AAC.1
MIRIIQFQSVLVFVLHLALSIGHALPSQSHNTDRDYFADDPDYVAPSGVGGIPQMSGGDGSV